MRVERRTKPHKITTTYSEHHNYKYMWILFYRCRKRKLKISGRRHFRLQPAANAELRQDGYNKGQTRGFIFIYCNARVCVGGGRTERQRYLHKIS
jgi:hypothetical protein